MSGVSRGVTLVCLLLALMTGYGEWGMAQSPLPTTTIADTVYTASGTPASGSVLVSWAGFTTASGASIPAGTTSATIGSNGALSISLAPNAGATPIGSYYTATFHLSDGTTSRQYCESAAQAILAFSTSRSAALSGTYIAVNPAQDIWPGDVLAITSNGVTTQLLARSVVAKDLGAQPEVLAYHIAFANDWAAEWADGIGLKLSERIATNAWLPPVAASAPAQVLSNLQQLAVTSLTTTAIQIDAGTAPPTGGGFEIRRTDWFFGPNTDAADLVMRSPVRSFSIPRAGQLESYYIRMYDASTPPIYSRFSSVVFTNAPVS